MFVHADGAGDPEGARRNLVDPAGRKVREDPDLGGHRHVAVVPVRETEAWTLADGDALREVFGTTLDDAALRVPASPREVEGIVDPKAELDAAYAAAQGGRKARRRKKAASLLEVVGERVCLSALAEVPAYRRLKTDLRAALRELNYL